MKSIEQLQKLAKNPYYTMKKEDKQRLDEFEKSQPKSSKSKSPKVQKRQTKDAATVKETGKLNKHSNDPVSE